MLELCLGPKPCLRCQEDGDLVDKLDERSAEWLDQVSSSSARHVKLRWEPGLSFCCPSPAAVSGPWRTAANRSSCATPVSTTSFCVARSMLISAHGECAP